MSRRLYSFAHRIFSLILISSFCFLLVSCSFGNGSKKKYDLEIQIGILGCGTYVMAADEEVIEIVVPCDGESHHVMLNAYKQPDDPESTGIWCLPPSNIPDNYPNVFQERLFYLGDYGEEVVEDNCIIKPGRYLFKITSEGSDRWPDQNRKIYIIAIEDYIVY